MVPTGGIDVKGKGMMDTYLWECPPGPLDFLASASTLWRGSSVALVSASTIWRGSSVGAPSSRIRKMLQGRLSGSPSLLLQSCSTVSMPGVGQQVQARHDHSPETNLSPEPTQARLGCVPESFLSAAL